MACSSHASFFFSYGGDIFLMICITTLRVHYKYTLSVYLDGIKFNKWRSLISLATGFWSGLRIPKGRRRSLSSCEQSYSICEGRRRRLVHLVWVSRGCQPGPSNGRQRLHKSPRRRLKPLLGGVSWSAFIYCQMMPFNEIVKKFSRYSFSLPSLSLFLSLEGIYVYFYLLFD